MNTILYPFFFLIFLNGFSFHNDDTVMKQTEKKILLGQFDPAQQPDYTEAKTPYTFIQGMYLHNETFDAFKKMHEAAMKDGVRLYIVSATRSFDRQKQIWENKWKGVTLVEGSNLSKTCADPVMRAEKILTYSSMPGTSRHHWGTDIDINSVSPEYFQKGKGVKEYQWLKDNAARFGFCQPYKMKGIERLTGYEDEPWHWSYLPLACRFTEDYIKTVTYNDLKGFAGAETAQQLEVINNYVLGIHPDCKCH